MPVDLPPGADQFPKALCQVRQGEAEDDREESGDVFRLARGAVSVCLGVGLVVEHQIRPGIKYSWAPNAAKH